MGESPPEAVTLGVTIWHHVAASLASHNPPPDSMDRSVIRRFDRARLIGLFVIAARLWTLLPIGIAAFMAVAAPTYFRPMFSAPIGIGLLAAGVVAIVGGYGVIEVGARLARRGGARLTWGLVLICGVCLLQFFVLWIVLLGPAIVILLAPQQS